MSNLKQIIAEEREKFEKVVDNFYIHRLAMHEGRAYVHPVVDKTELNDWLSAHDSRLLEAQAKELVERVEKEKEPYKEDFKCGGDNCEACRITDNNETRGFRFNSALSRVQEIIRTSLNE